MRGLIKTKPGKGKMQLREKPIPVPGPDQVLIRVKSTGICGSDLHIYNWDTQLNMNPPMIIGHEFSGEAVEIGKDVSTVSSGDRFTAEPTFSTCGNCQYCHSGYYTMCP